MNHVACPNKRCELHQLSLLDDTGEQHICRECGTPLEPIETPVPDHSEDPDIGRVYEGGPAVPDPPDEFVA